MDHLLISPFCSWLGSTSPNMRYSPLASSHIALHTQHSRAASNTTLNTEQNREKKVYVHRHLRHLPPFFARNVDAVPPPPVCCHFTAVCLVHHARMSGRLLLISHTWSKSISERHPHATPLHPPLQRHLSSFQNSSPPFFSPALDPPPRHNAQLQQLQPRL